MIITDRIETRWITLIGSGMGKLRVLSDGLVEDGERTVAAVEAVIEQLHQQGWILVGQVDHPRRNSNAPKRDLFFRKSVAV